MVSVFDKNPIILSIVRRNFFFAVVFSIFFGFASVSRLTLFHNDDTVTLLFMLRLRMRLQYGRMRLFGQKSGGDGVDFARN